MPDKKQTKTDVVEGLIRRTFFGEDEHGAVRMSSIDEKEHTAEFIIATDLPVRDSWGPPTSLSMKPGAVVLKEFRSNPTVTANHDMVIEAIVGNSIKEWQETIKIGDRNVGVLLSRLLFDVADNGAGAAAWGKVIRGFLRGTSNIYWPLRQRMVEEGQKDSETGLEGPVRIATQWKLKAYGLVAVGADAESLGRSVTEADLNAVAREEPQGAAVENKPAVAIPKRIFHFTL
jgi:hypothetical protein